ncbi:MAG: HD domain-containing protein [Elusimicrobia bacterium]|nr:HD domain-containing protein [Elusimicrobiota bacterium]
MKKEDLDFFHSWFRNYVKPYYTGNDDVKLNLRLKEEHIHRVCRSIVELGKDLGLVEYKLQTAEIIALFHDIGRFEQLRRYKTLNDRCSINHAELSVEVVKETNVLERLEEEERAVILKSIRYHNAYKLPENELPDFLLYTKLLRDADKIDIWFIVADYYEKRQLHPNTALEFDLPDEPDCSSAIIDDIMNCRCTCRADIKTYNDMKLFQLSWIFDINFPASFHYIQEHNYIDKIINTLPDTSGVKKVRNHLNSYIDRNIKDNHTSRVLR